MKHIDNPLIVDPIATSLRIKELIDKDGATISEIAVEMGVTYQTVYKWTRANKCMPDITNLFHLSQLLEVSIEEIVVLHN